MATPPTLPISTPQSTNPTTTASTTAFGSFITRISSSLRHALSDRRPWSELLDRTSLSRPDTLSEAYSRIRKNASYFRVNYVTLITIALALSLITHPLSLLTLLLLIAAWTFLYLLRPTDNPLVLCGRALSQRETLGGLLILTIIVVFLTNVGSLLISALAVGLAIVCAHGAFRVPEDLFLDEQEIGNGGNVGFLSFLGGAASSVVAATGAAPVGSRV
ncbi:hypothetical protein RIF29_08762 [Crotalaria pallida]|uniref:PRA1 family protein n=1 Tax=Crotalaria pallida TaxID=3830 RepID=A0AAN9ILK3_CROPI